MRGTPRAAELFHQKHRLGVWCAFQLATGHAYMGVTGLVYVTESAG
jgi:hypothetical protein